MSRERPALDRVQQEFCAIPEGSVRLLAPAGCGKTYSLLYRCKALAEREAGARPRFLVFTFTRAARDELRDRLKKLSVFQDIAGSVQIATLNSWGFRVLKNRVSTPKLITTGDQRYLCVNNILRPVWSNYERLRVLLEDSRRVGRAVDDVWSAIQFLKSMGLRHDRVTDVPRFERAVAHLEACGLGNQLRAFFRLLRDMGLVDQDTPALAEVFEHFVLFWREASELLGKVASFSLEDQKYWARIFLEDDLARGRLATGQARYHYILVDEFQDINPLDLALLKAISAMHKAPLTVVGDDDQAIYEWRGATPEFILSPDQYVGGTYKTCILERNYRSPRNIVEMSMRLIGHNRRRVEKNVVPVRRDDAEVFVHRYEWIHDAVDSNVALVKRLLEHSEDATIALIGRKRSQIIPYQIVFAGEGIPFYAAEDLHVFLSEAFQDLRTFLAIRGRQNSGPMFDIDPISDLLKLCDKIKRYPLAKKDREALRTYLYRSGAGNLREAAIALGRYQGPLKGSNEGGRMSTEFSEAVLALLDAQTVTEAINAISVRFEGLQKDYGKSLDDIFYADPPFLYLAEFAERYGEDYDRFYQDLDKAMKTLARVIPDEVGDDGADAGADVPKERLHLMTALRAKGKEFDVVIILDANQGVWPSRFAQDERELEQERRLFYVAVTRARKQLHFSLSDCFLGEVHTASPFLAEMGLAVPPSPTANYARPSLRVRSYGSSRR
ncbi:MAG: hypothetical protein KatS3mg077_1158 [Candidatus Binatia bacterium]|nr:MAG: hypothetical protein KatS3mg077_1158 [Candidatus Binatia bacterium]